MCRICPCIVARVHPLPQQPGIKLYRHPSIFFQKKKRCAKLKLRQRNRASVTEQELTNTLMHMVSPYPLYQVFVKKALLPQRAVRTHARFGSFSAAKYARALSANGGKGDRLSRHRQWPFRSAGRHRCARQTEVGTLFSRCGPDTWRSAWRT